MRKKIYISEYIFLSKFSKNHTKIVHKNLRKLTQILRGQMIKSVSYIPAQLPVVPFLAYVKRAFRKLKYHKINKKNLQSYPPSNAF